LIKEYCYILVLKLITELICANQRNFNIIEISGALKLYATKSLRWLLVASSESVAARLMLWLPYIITFFSFIVARLILLLLVF